MEISKLLTGYFKKQRSTLLMLLMFIIIFMVIFFLYGLPLEPFIYGLLLCFSIGGIYLICYFWDYHKRHRQLDELKNQIYLDTSKMPWPQDLLEQDYQELLEILFQNKVQLTTKAETAAREMEEYYTLWVHQIKTPISAMRLLLQADENQKNTELELELLKIEQYVEMVLHYLRVESPSSDFLLKQYNLDNIVSQAVRKYAKLFIHKKIRLDFSELNCQVITDEKWLVFVIEQVLANALKYTNKGTISIYMADQDRKILVIEDTGIGIDPEDLPRVFEQGFTGNIGRLDKRSTGIGLYLCKRILTRLSHTITLDSEVGKGTKVKIGLDVVDLEIK